MVLLSIENNKVLEEKVMQEKVNTDCHTIPFSKAERERSCGWCEHKKGQPVCATNPEISNRRFAGENVECPDFNPLPEWY